MADNNSHIVINTNDVGILLRDRNGIITHTVFVENPNFSEYSAYDMLIDMLTTHRRSEYEGGNIAIIGEIPEDDMAKIKDFVSMLNNLIDRT